VKEREEKLNARTPGHKNAKTGFGTSVSRPSGSVRRAVLAGVACGSLLLVLVRTFVIAVYRVTSASMAPALLGGDRVLIDRLAYCSRPPSRGDVVMYRRSGDEEPSVKRVIGLGGDQIDLQRGMVRVNGTALDGPIVGEVSFDPDGESMQAAIPMPERSLSEETLDGRAWRVAWLRETPPSAGVWKVPPDALFVLGDNRGASTDSRDPSVGFIPREAVLGRVSRVVYSTGQRGVRSRWWQAVP
jgi:signal peptidase I